MQFAVLLLLAVIAAAKADDSPVYHWHIQLLDPSCPVPSSSIRTTASYQRVFNWFGRRKRDITLDKFTLKHSMVFFRNKYYEWANDDFIYTDGGLGRKGGAGCYGTKTYAGRSRCTREQADRLGSWYIRHNSYNLLKNNCHHYAEWLINNLVNNRCYLVG